MATYHIKENGEPSPCKAKPGNCPLGGDHYASAAEARAAYEESNENSFKNLFSSQGQEELHEELRSWVQPGPFGGFLNHPLVQDLMVDATPGLANRMFEAKKKRVAQALEQEDWNSFVYLHERPYRVAALSEVLADYSVDNPEELIASVWVDSENIHQNHEEWRVLLSTYGVAMTKEERKILSELPTEVTVHRGCSAGGEEGFSWTLDEDKAQWFAQRFSSESPQVLTATVDKGSIVAYLDRRGEAEVIILPGAIVRDSLRRTKL